MAYNKNLADKFLNEPDSYRKQIIELWKLKREKEKFTEQPQNSQTASETSEPDSDTKDAYSKGATEKSRSVMLFLFFAILAAILIYVIYKALKEDPVQNTSYLKSDGSVDLDRFFKSPAIKTGKSIGKWVAILMAVSLILWSLGFVISQVKDLEKKVRE